MQKKTFILLTSTILTLSFIWIAITPLLFPVQGTTENNVAPHQGFFAPEFTLQTPTGETHSLSDYNGPVLVFLWASWCSVCKRTMPDLQSVYEEFNPKGFEVLAINTTFQDSLSNATDYFQSKGYTFTFLLDMTGDVSRKYQLHALPTSVLISPEGVVIDVLIGSGLSEGILSAHLNDILGESE